MQRAVCRARVAPSFIVRALWGAPCGLWAARGLRRVFCAQCYGWALRMDTVMRMKKRKIRPKLTQTEIKPFTGGSLRAAHALARRLIRWPWLLQC